MIYLYIYIYLFIYFHDSVHHFPWQTAVRLPKVPSGNVLTVLTMEHHHVSTRHVIELDDLNSSLQRLQHWDQSLRDRWSLGSGHPFAECRGCGRGEVGVELVF
jgi:hypothetical protein